MHLYTRLPSDWGARHGRSLASPKSSRAEDGGRGNIAFIIVGVLIAVLLLVVLAVHFIRRNRRQQAGSNTSQKPRPGGWRRFLSPFKSEPGRYQATSGDDSAELDHTPGRTNRPVQERNNATGNRSSATAAVDRNTSVRSVLTLPPYSHAASNTERVIGREGERDGVDVVVDYRGEQEEEALRETEMDALYQLRAARRQQMQERDELRRQRREAQQRQDYATLSDLRSRARATSSSNNNVIEELRQDIDRAKENRQRSASSVSYAELGVARHDGTRLRASSQESERMGLLSDAADMGNAPRSGANSPMPHQRSASPVISIDSDFPSPGLSRTRGRSPAPSRLSYPSGLAGSSPELVESDLGVESMPPPEYENVSLDDDDNNIARSTTPNYEPPPDYPGPYRSDSGRSQHSAGRPASVEGPSPSEREDENHGRGVGGVPQLPSLRIGRLPSIVVEPSSAHPRDGHDEHDASEHQR